jgi:hypothetical protein
MFDRESLQRVNADQLVTRTDRLLLGGISKRRASRPAWMQLPVERTVLVAPLPAPRPFPRGTRPFATTRVAPRAPWRAMVLGAMAGMLAGALAIAHIAHSEDAHAIAAQTR